MRWTEDAKQLIVDRCAESAREVGLLWFVFSLLDKLVAGQLTIPWFVMNSVSSVAIMFIGTYIEVKTKCPTNTSRSSHF